jgi:isopropylmalate/homocitrate/citramalate synthase
VTFDLAQAAARDLLISDTTFRDGQQSRPPYTVAQIARLYEMLSRLSGPNGVIRHTEFFLYSRKDREAVEACQALNLRYPEITGWVRADHGDLSLVEQMGLKETGILCSCSDYHIFYKLRSDRRKILDHYASVAEAALTAGVCPRCHLEDVTRADIDGFVVPLVQRLMRLSEGAPEWQKVKIRLCDTMGFGISYPGAALPRSVAKLCHRMVHDAGCPSHRLEWHGHNDFHKVHVNAASAWLYGCNFANATLLGFGERTGNPPLEGLVFEYMGLRGTANGMDTHVVTEIAEYYERELGTPAATNYPFVGRDFNRTRAGIHADGLSRDERIYNIFDTVRHLNRPPMVSVTDKSGVDGVVLWVNQFLRLEGDERVNKIKVVKIGRWVADEYDRHGRMTVISDAELEEQVRTHLPDLYERYKHRIRR